ncbi:hypothetical protein SADUNF_Sadunf06G0078600 [Salix dunnii]|uniref:LIMR family protein n=1 Tax=Salix dunnii TaxID=1413687 RepID=A0A835K819_9ROSI|nr:hypothetical protein SADUNF_Sadunf06G0078600 [Salix dunnii]
MGDFNLALVIVAIVVCIIVLLFNVYLLVNYQHPDDKNQAYFPKFVVVFGLSVAAISILMLPADVANRQACRRAIYNGACNLTLPMKDLWIAVYIVDAVLVFFIIPFAMFYYEGDQDKSVAKRIKSALLWVITTAIVCGLVLGILYGIVDIYIIYLVLISNFFIEDNQNVSSGMVEMVRILFNRCNVHAIRLILFVIILGVIGKVDFTVRHLSSSTTTFPSTWDFSSSQPCIGSGAHQCSAYPTNASSEKTWTMRATFPEYIVALATIVGSVLFACPFMISSKINGLKRFGSWAKIFGGVGIACLPLGLIFSFIRRPKAVITRSQYIKVDSSPHAKLQCATTYLKQLRESAYILRFLWIAVNIMQEATELGKKARELKKAADALHQEERSGSKGRKWRKNVKSVEKELLQLEEDVKLLEEVYPQGEKAETSWALTVLGYLAKLVLGILG